MRRVARIAGGARAMHELAQLLVETDAHGDHRAAGAKRWDHSVAFFQGQAAADGNRFLPFARKRLRRDFPFMLPANQRFLEKPRDEHVLIEAPFEAGLPVARYW